MRKLNILVVDDNEDAASSLQMFMAAEGHNAVAAFDGATCLRLVAANQYDIILLDIGMPIMNGYEVIKRLRQGGVKSKIVAVTGWGSDADRTACREAGFDMHLVKPVDPAELLARVMTLLP